MADPTTGQNNSAIIRQDNEKLIRELKAEVKANAKLIKQLDEEKSATDIAFKIKEPVMPLSARVLPILPSAAQMAVSCCATANLKDWLSNQGNA